MSELVNACVGDTSPELGATYTTAAGPECISLNERRVARIPLGGVGPTRDTQPLLSPCCHPVLGTDEEGMRRRASATSYTSEDVSSVSGVDAPRDCSELVYTFVNGVTGKLDGDIRLSDLPTVDALLKLDEMAVAELGDALKAGGLAEVVLIRPTEELNSLPLVDEAVLEDTNGSVILKDLSDRFHALLLEYGDVVSKTPPTEHCDVIDAYFRSKQEAGLYVSTLHANVVCQKAKRQVAHCPCFYKLNAATIPAQMPIPRKDDLQNNMVGCILYSALDLVDDYYQLLMRASDIPLTAVSAPSVIPAPSGVRTDCMRTNKLYANADKCIFGAEEIPFLGCFIGKRGFRADPAKVKAVPFPENLKDLWKWLGFANYFHTYSENYADLARPLSNLLKKDAECTEIGLPEPDRPFSVVCAISDFAIGYAPLQVDADERERVITFESQQLKAAEKNYPVHDKGLLDMKHALVEFRVRLLVSKPFVISTNNVSLRIATQSPHLSRRMACWLSFFAEYNFAFDREHPRWQSRSRSTRRLARASRC
ncbi:LOW QUALITY PROTEIN: Reverse transcriptase [Phytophthora palmivora]|uniref:Reverse transcriptase n=1 Tax=Phytophthora palmivora TaxID=4796 RepID=A0A2P4Y759_9STRA|nr:LOW QUALITY PROTEIN: Reverse transcriptase [Phytophthora palmivora]